MRTLVAIASFAAGAVAKDVHIPGGRIVDERCIIEVPHGEIFHADEEHAVEGCQGLSTSSKLPQVQIYAADVHVQSPVPITSFTADWTVPAKPVRSHGQVVYFWPGFKSKSPEMGYPVLQPVLQYNEYRQDEWRLQSWFVDAKSSFWYPVARGRSIVVNPGDKITSYMNLSADGKTWTVYGKDLTTGKNSTLTITHAKAGNCDYDYAMLVNENVGVNTECDLMPSQSSIRFTNVKVNGASPSWVTRANCHGNSQCDCGNSAVVESNGDVTLGWNPHPADQVIV